MKARTFALRPPVGGCVPGFAAWAAAFLGLLMLGTGEEAPPLAALFVLPLLVGLLVTLWRWPPTVRVGTDGLWIGRVWRRELIPIRDIEAIDWVQGPANRIREDLPGLIVRRRGGPPVKLPMLGLAVIHRDELYAAIDEARTAAAARRSRAVAPLARAGRSLPRWRRDLMGMMRGGFRDGALTQGELADVLDDPGAEIEHRVGAALALQAVDGERARVRIKAVAEQCAAPKLRVALDLAAGGDESLAELEQVLEEAREPRQPQSG